MEELLLDILARLRSGKTFDDRSLNALIMSHNKAQGPVQRVYAKRKLLPFYFEVKERLPARWAAWHVSPELERLLLATLRLKPRRSASGVSSVTVLTKPHPCPGACIFCPNDLSMPKSYLKSEPACQRAAQCCFDPYLQVAARLRSLYQMGHPVDEVELVVLGGSWTEYPKSYRLWFVSELYRALNEFSPEALPNFSAFSGDLTGDLLRARARQEGDAARGRDVADRWTGVVLEGPWNADDVRRRRMRYAALGFDTALEGEFAAIMQRGVDAGTVDYNAAVAELYGSRPWRQAAAFQTAGWNEVEMRMRDNEAAACRCMGLSVETRPDCVNAIALAEMARMGCDKLQLGVQSLDARVLSVNGRGQTVAGVKHALGLARLFGLRVHAHYMLNLYRSRPALDIAGFSELAREGLCDEVKLYPCVVVAGTRLAQLAAEGAWKPYVPAVLAETCAACVKAAPAWMRISRMVRDISTDDILAGNKVPNLRQVVDARLREEGAEVFEMRWRELGTKSLDGRPLHLRMLRYRSKVGAERFLQVVTDEGTLVAFARLTLPDAVCIEREGSVLPVGRGWALLRELHVYGSAETTGHLETLLREKLVERAADVAASSGFAKLAAVASPGVRPFLRGTGFKHDGLLMCRDL